MDPLEEGYVESNGLGFCVKIQKHLSRLQELVLQYVGGGVEK